jgi:hypothetical protein
MNQVCLKSMLLGAAIVLIIMLVMGAAINNNNVNGRYQITSHIYSSTSRVFVIDTQTGEVRSIHIASQVRPTEYYHGGGIDKTEVYTSGPWTK